ncbi:MAG: DUF357 domain-containing protein [Candidatus Diapherotrites archaeon]
MVGTKNEIALAEKVKHYRKLTEEALGKASILQGITPAERKKAEDFLSMARNYFSDARHFEEKGDLPTALAAYSYSHAWLDAGVRAGWLDGKGDDKLFTLP